MSAQPRLGGVSGGLHPALLSRRVHDLVVTALAASTALLLALAITIEMPSPDPALVFGLLIGVIVTVALIASTRYELTLTLVVLYIGLLDGPIKLLSASQYASAIRDVLIYAVVVSMIARMGSRGERITLPPLAGWVVLFVGVVLVEALNPGTAGILKALGGFRQQLEWVPFFFFGYLLMRSKQSFRKLFLVLGVIALANGLVGAYQSRLSPSALAGWGPGYSARIGGSKGISGRTYSAEGVARPRPPALGSDSGFGGGVGVLALPGLLALLSVPTRVRRRRWVYMLLLAGALLGVATSASRTSIVIAVVALLSYGILSVVAGLKVGRPLLAMLAVAVVAVGVTGALISADGGGIFKRQETLASASPESGETATKFAHFSQLPADIAGAPFGVGLGTGGSAGGFGGKQKVTIEGSGASKEGALNLVVLETGALGLFLWVGLTVSVIVLALRRLRSIRDVELRTYLVAIFAAFLAFTAAGFAGPTLAVSGGGTFLWFGPGVAAYWLAGRGFAAQHSMIARTAT